MWRFPNPQIPTKRVMTTAGAPLESEDSRPAVFSLHDPSALRAGLRAARIALGKKQLVVIPTDTHYAIAADAFSPAGWAALARFKGWSEQPAPQVLLPNPEALYALGAEVPRAITRLTEALWPGPLTVVVPAGNSVRWSLGEAVESLGLSLIAHEVTRELLADTGPLIISAAHPVGQPPESFQALIDAGHRDLAVVLVDDTLPWGFSHTPTSVVEVVQDPEHRNASVQGVDHSVTLRLLREGVIAGDQLRDVAGDDVVWR